MMLVRSYLSRTSDNRLGVFAGDDIEMGTLVRVFDPRYDVSYLRDDLATMPVQFRDLLDRHAHAHPSDPDMIVLDCDEGRFIAHSSTPSIDLANPVRGIAGRFIAAGEELTCDHAAFTTSAVGHLPARYKNRPVALV